MMLQVAEPPGQGKTIIFAARKGQKVAICMVHTIKEHRIQGAFKGHQDGVQWEWVQGSDRSNDPTQLQQDRVKGLLNVPQPWRLP